LLSGSFSERVVFAILDDAHLQQNLSAYAAKYNQARCVAALEDAMGPSEISRAEQR
jgi:hypothetical protein